MAVRPVHEQYIGVYTEGGTYGQLAVQRNGDMWLSGPSDGPSKEFSSLAGVSFLAPHTRARPLHLENGWRPGPALDHAGVPAGTLIDGVLYLSGELRDPSTTHPLLGVLPRADRPSRQLYMIANTSDWAPGVLQVSPNGKILLYGGNARMVTDLDGLSYSVTRSGWHKLPLINLWESLQTMDHTGTPSYRVSGGVVYLSGAVRQNSQGNVTLTTLPPAARPAHTLYICTYDIGGALGELVIEHDGMVESFGSPQQNAVVFTSLAGISYPVNS